MSIIQGFIDSLRFENRYSEHTLLAYYNDIHSFNLFLIKEFPEEEIEKAKPHIIRAWMVDLSEKGLKPTSINRKISSLKSFFNFLQKTQKSTNNPFLLLKPLKAAKNLPQYVSETSMENLFDNIEFSNHYAGELDKTILSLFYATGMRLSELTGLKESDIDFFNLNIKVLGKRNKQRIIPLNTEVANQLKAYLKSKKMEFNNKFENNLFITKNGKPIYSKFVYRRVHYYLGLITTLTKRSPHIIRHTFATHLLNNGADLNAIKEILGHASLAATQIYTHNSIEKLKLVYKQAHPKA